MRLAERRLGVTLTMGGFAPDAPQGTRLATLRSASLALALPGLLVLGCKKEAPDVDRAATSSAVASASAALVPGRDDPPPTPKGMVWIPPGILLAGTPEGRLPRLADAEMPGSQVVMKGFFIDEFPLPNEAGAIPRGGLSYETAEAACASQGKRLCTELEWERACKGPDNKTYPYGDTHRPASCMTGTVSPAVPPVGVLPSCKSAFGVRDTHGGVFQWTSSPWGRGTVGNLYTLRGGNAAAGDVIGRCANAIGRRPTEVKPDFGARCCSGDRNVAEVTLDVVRGDALRSIGNDDALSRSLAEAPPRELTEALAKSGGDFKVYHTWRWRPIGNEDLVLQSGCAQARNAPHAMCGIAIGRKKGDALEPLAFAPSSWWLPTVHEDPDPRDLWIFGGDELGGYRRRVSYSFGRIVVDEPEHKAVPKKKKKRRD